MVGEVSFFLSLAYLLPGPAKAHPEFKPTSGKGVVAFTVEAAAAAFGLLFYLLFAKELPLFDVVIRPADAEAAEAALSTRRTLFVTVHGWR